MVEFFDRIAPSWEDRYAHCRSFKARYRMFETAVSQHGSGSRRALDYGCGPGVLTAILQKAFESVVATDISENMLDIARRKYADCPNVEVSKIEALPKSQFDIAICSSVIEYVDDPNIFMANLAYYLHPGGILLITFANRFGPMQILSRCILSRFKRSSYTNFQRNLYSRRSILNLIKAHRLECMELSSPIGLPLLTALGLGDLYLLVARKKS